MKKFYPKRYVPFRDFRRFASVHGLRAGARMACCAPMVMDRRWYVPGYGSRAYERLRERNVCCGCRYPDSFPYCVECRDKRAEAARLRRIGVPRPYRYRTRDERARERPANAARMRAARAAVRAELGVWARVLRRVRARVRTLRRLILL